MKRTSPSHTTHRQIQEAVHAHSLETLDDSPFHAHTTPELIGMRDAILANRRLNHKPAEIIQRIIDQREQQLRDLEEWESDYRFWCD